MTGAEQSGGPNPASMRMLSLARSVYRDGDFSDQRLQRASGIAAMGGQYQQIMDARAERSSRERIAGIKAQSDVDIARINADKNLTKEEKLWKFAQYLQKSRGGNVPDIFAYLMNNVPEADLDGNIESIMRGVPFNIGTDQGAGGTDLLDASYDADGNVVPGSVEDVLGLGQGGAGAVPGQAAPVPATGSPARSGSGAAAASTDPTVSPGSGGRQNSGQEAETWSLRDAFSKIFTRRPAAFGGKTFRELWKEERELGPKWKREKESEGGARQTSGQLGTDSDNLFESIIKAESGGDPSAVSPKGARGLMQIMPDTARQPGFDLPNVFELADEMGIPYAGKTDKAVARLLENPELNRAFGENSSTP